MTTYRVGEQGATVWHADGRLLGSLPPGVIIVPATEGVPGPAPEPPERIADGKRVRGYDDKVIRPERDTGI
jgi:hypothetical protein